MPLTAKELAQLSSIERDLTAHEPVLADEFAAFSGSPSRHARPASSRTVRPATGPGSTSWACLAAILGLQLGLAIAAGGFALGQLAVGIAGLVFMAIITVGVVRHFRSQRRQARATGG